MKFAAVLLLICLFFCGWGNNKGQENITPDPVITDISDCKEINTYAIRESSLNPLLVSSDSGKNILSLVFRPLFTVDQSFNTVPCLAEKIKFSNACTTVDISLKQNILWDDGSAFTSDDVNYTINKIIEYGEESPYFQFFSNVSGYAPDGKHGYRFVLKNADSGFAALLNFPIVKKGSLGNEIILTGTGDYRITEYKDYTSFLLVAKAPTDKENICKIKVLLLPNNEAAYSGFKLGQIDLFRLSSEDSTAYAVDETKNFISTNTNRYTFLAVNHSNSSLSDASVRKIISQITSSDVVVSDLMHDFAVKAESMVQPSAHFAVKNAPSSDDLKLKLDSLGYITNEAGVRVKNTSDGEKRLSFSLLVNSDNHSKVIAAEYISNLLTSYGISVTLASVPYSSYVDALIGGSFDLALCETMISLNNDYSFLIGTEGRMNFGGYSSEKMDSLMNSALLCADKAEKAKILGSVQSLFYTDIPHIPLWFSTPKIIYNSSVVNPAEIGGISDDFDGISNWKLR